MENLKTYHTSGPWKIRNENEIICPAKKQIALIATRANINKGCIDRKETNTNARLIAKAPDLLDILQDILYQYDKIGGRIGFTDLDDSINILGRNVIWEIVSGK